MMKRSTAQTILDLQWKFHIIICCFAKEKKTKKKQEIFSQADYALLYLTLAHVLTAENVIWWPYGISNVVS